MHCSQIEMGLHYSLVLAVLVTIIILVQRFTSGHIINVKKDGVDIECFKNTTAACKSLEGASHLLNRYGANVTIDIVDNVSLNFIFQVVNASNIRIVGISNRTVIQCGRRNAGFVIDNAYNFSFINLTVKNCTAQKELFYFAMLVKESSNVVFKNFRFENYSKTAMVLVNNWEKIRIENNSFVNYRNRNCSNDGSNTSQPGALSILQNSEDANQKVQYTITDSLFLENASPFLDISTREYRESAIRDRGYGGAVFVEFGGNTTQSSVTISGSSFVRNCALRGAGVYAYYQQQARENRIAIEHCQFEHNRANISGGGVNIVLFSAPALMNTFSISNSNFTYNYGFAGAGLSMYSTYDKQKPRSGLINVTNSIWIHNSGVLGSGVDMVPINIENEGYLPVPEFSNCTFINNTVNDLVRKPGRTYHLNVGVFAITRFKAVFGGKMCFKSNRYSALSLVSGVVEFRKSSSVLFVDNFGYDGGAIAMYGFSSIVFNHDSTFIFSNNRALNYGGAIYHHTIDQHSFFKSDTQCFLRNTLKGSTSTLIKTIEVIFEGNQARGGGQDIYVDSFNSCSRRCTGNNPESNTNIRSIFNCIGNFNFTKNPKPLLMSSARKFVFNTSTNCNDTSIAKCDLINATIINGQPVSYENQFSCKVIPGDQICLPFEVVDDFDNTVRPLLSISHTKFKGVSVKDPYTLSNTIQPHGEPDSTTQFTLSVLGMRQIYFFFNITLLPCPPGFYADITSGTCSCLSGKDEYAEITQCENSQAHYKNNLWAGYIPKYSTNYTDLYFAPCEKHLCNSKTHSLPRDEEQLVETICNENREGIMCGKCKKSHSTYFNSEHFKCGRDKYCYLGMLFYTLSEIIPLVVFFIIVVTFDFSFTSGSSVGFIFFTQHLDLLTTKSGPLLSALHIPYSVFYGLFNYEFFNINELSFCMWKGAEILDLIVLKLLSAVMALGLILVLVATIRKNMCKKLWQIRKRVSTKTSVVHGLSAFLVICYAQCTKMSFYILKFSQPVGYAGAKEKYYTYYGGLPYFYQQHLFYAIPAMISVVFVTILPPLVLLLYPLSLQLLSTCGLSEHWMVNKTLQLTGINKLKPFIDCFQSCYKDKFRFFAGLYFVYRIAFLVVFNFSHNSLFFSIWCAVLFIIFIGIHSTVQPYKESLHNTIDSLVFFNLALINGCVLLNQAVILHFDDQVVIKKFTTAINSFQLFLLYLPLIVVFCLLFKHAFALLKCKLNCCKAQPENSDSQVIDNILDVPSASEQSGILGSTVSASAEGSTDPKFYGSIRDTY